MAMTRGETTGAVNTSLFTTNIARVETTRFPHNANTNTIYGVPVHTWHMMSQKEQMYHAERYREREREDIEKNFHDALVYVQQQQRATVKKSSTPDFMNNTLLLLEN